MGAGSLARPHERQVLARDALPAQAKVRGNIGSRRPAQLGGHIVPPDPVPEFMLGRVEAVAPQVGVVDTAHEGDLVVDDEDLLVMRVERTLVVIE